MEQGLADVGGEHTTHMENETQYRTIVENAAEAIVIIRSGKIRFFNTKALRLSGYAESELARMPCLKLIHPDDRRMVISEYRRALNSRQPVSPYAFRITDKAGNLKWLEITHEPTSWNGQQAVLAFVSDITERKRLEQQFFQAQKMEAVGRLAGGIAHDFNNILTVILGYAELMAQVADNRAAMAKNIEAIRQAAKKGAGLTQKLLAFSRKQLLQPKVLDLNVLIVGMEAILKRLLGEGIVLVQNLHPQLGSIHADTSQIEQIILNLAVNAKDAMDDGGRLIIETDNIEFSNDDIQSGPEMRAGSYVKLAISDTGSGMSEDVKSHLFEPFFTTKESGRGTGLGLATVYGIIKQSNGFIYVYSERGQGTTFKLYFPRISERPAQRESLGGPERSLMGAETVLLLEDEEQVLKLVERILKKHGYKVLAARSAEEALVYCKQNTIPVNLLIADVGIPGMNGRRVWDLVNESFPQARVLFISGYPQDFSAIEDLTEERNIFLQKPFSSETLLQRVREILGGGNQGA
jgi:two-component system cell cycle sensor histidine kinase/response regulator CckA